MKNYKKVKFTTINFRGQLTFSPCDEEDTSNVD